MHIEYYKTEGGVSPIDEYLDNLDIKMRVKVLRTIGLLRLNGTKLGMPYSRPLENGIFELRTQLGNNIERVLYFFVVGECAVLTNGFTKKQQKTPKREISLANARRIDYLRRHS